MSDDRLQSDMHFFGILPRPKSRASTANRHTSQARHVCENDTASSSQSKPSDSAIDTITPGKNPAQGYGVIDRRNGCGEFVGDRAQHCADTEQQSALDGLLDEHPTTAHQRHVRLDRSDSRLTQSTPPSPNRSESKHEYLVSDANLSNEHPEKELAKLEHFIRTLIHKYDKFGREVEQSEPKVAELAQDHRALLFKIQAMNLDEESKVDRLKRECDRLNKRCDKLEQSHASCKSNAISRSNHHQEQIQRMNEKQSKDEEQIRSLHSQLSALREGVSTMNKVPEQATDDSLRNLMSKLSHDIENWALNGYRGLKIGPSFGHLSEDAFNIIGAVIPGSYLDKHLSKAAICQAIVFSQLSKIFCATPFFELPPTLEWAGLKHLWDIVLLDNENFNLWRANTLTALFRAPTPDIVAHTNQAASTLCKGTCSAIDELMVSSWNEKRYQQLRRIVEDAIDLSKLLRSQLASFEVVCYGPEMAYDPIFMDSNLEDDDAKQCSVLLTVAPALVKIGNEFGQRADQNNVISKAKVLCSVNESSDDELSIDIV